MGCIKRITGCLITLIVIAVLILGAVYFLVIPQLTTRIENGLRKKLMLGPSAEVEITDTGVMALSQGRIEHVRVVADEALIDNYVVKDLNFEADGLTFDLVKTIAMNDPTIVSLGSGDLEFYITAEALQNAWADAAAKIGISDLKVSIVPSKLSIKLDGVWKIDWLKAEYPFEATGKLDLERSSVLFFTFPEIKIGKLKIGLARLQDALSGVSPRINLGDYRLSITLEDVQFSKDGMRIRAQAESTDEQATGIPDIVPDLPIK
jgi:hypothetical protein